MLFCPSLDEEEGVCESQLPDLPRMVVLGFCVWRALRASLHLVHPILPSALCLYA